MLSKPRSGRRSPRPSTSTSSSSTCPRGSRASAQRGELARIVVVDDVSQDSTLASKRTKTKGLPAASGAPAPEAPRRRPLLALLGLLALGAIVAAYMAVAHVLLFHGTG